MWSTPLRGPLTECSRTGRGLADGGPGGGARALCVQRAGQSSTIAPGSAGVCCRPSGGCRALTRERAALALAAAAPAPAAASTMQRIAALVARHAAQPGSAAALARNTTSCAGTVTGALRSARAGGTAARGLSETRVQCAPSTPGCCSTPTCGGRQRLLGRRPRSQFCASACPPRCCPRLPRRAAAEAAMGHVHTPHACC